MIIRNCETRWWTTSINVVTEVMEVVDCDIAADILVVVVTVVLVQAYVIFITNRGSFCFCRSR
jgi:hypothetical protein